MWRVARSAATTSLRQSQRRMSTAIPLPSIVHKRGTDILHDPWFNKVCFSASQTVFVYLGLCVDLDGYCFRWRLRSNFSQVLVIYCYHLLICYYLVVYGVC